MTIEITSPEVEALIQQRMKTGAFKNPEDLIRVALRSAQPDTRTGADLIAAMQACPHPEAEPSRMPCRECGMLLSNGVAARHQRHFGIA